MRGLSAPVVLMLGLAAVVGCSTQQRRHGSPGDDAVSLAAFGARHGLAYSTEENGKGVLSGNGCRVVVQDGVSSAVVNGSLVPLGGPASVDGAQALVPKDGAERIASALGSARAAEPTGPTAQVPHEKQPARPARPITVVIDPGHGGKFDGAKARNGLEEKTVNLDVARRLRDALTKLGVKVLMTRDSDREVAGAYRDDLDARVRLAERSGADLFVSIHSNFNRDPGIVGFEVYRSRDDSRSDVVKRLESHLATNPSYKSGEIKSASALYGLNRLRTAAFADEVRTGMRSTGIPDRGVRDAGFHVIKWAPCPAVLVEMDYLSNPVGAQRLGGATTRQRVAEALAGAIARFGARLDRIGVK